MLLSLEKFVFFKYFKLVSLVCNSFENNPYMNEFLEILSMKKKNENPTNQAFEGFRGKSSYFKVQQNN
jgi:hypothetical protein